MNTLVVNLFAGPGAGKSTAAAYLFAKVKMQGINAEYVTEYAKDVTWEHADLKLHCQLYVTGKQAYKMTRVYGKVDVIITDSPLALGSMYTDDELIKAVCISEQRKYDSNSFNIFLERNPNIKYQTEGRNQTADEAIALDERIKNMLDANNFHYTSVIPTAVSLDTLADMIVTVVQADKKK